MYILCMSSSRKRTDAALKPARRPGQLRQFEEQLPHISMHVTWQMRGSPTCSHWETLGPSPRQHKLQPAAILSRVLLDHDSQLLVH